MKLKFEQDLDYQKEALSSIVNLLKGQVNRQKIVSFGSHRSLISEVAGVNSINLTDEEILSNLQKVQIKNGIEKSLELKEKRFSIEMETGTGKTYVYLRSIFELNREYGLKKFIIVVPNIAIREGVLKSIELMKEHFRFIYENIPFNYFVYDSSKLTKLRDFETSNQIQIMIINIQSFQKDVVDREAILNDRELKKLNVINRENDRMSGRKPIESIQITNPIVIIDEPQSVDNTPKARNAIENLNPSIVFRYSATHRDATNLIYKLDPIKAYEMGLVKSIEVASISSKDNFNGAYVKFIDCNNKGVIKARLEFYKQSKTGIKTEKIWVKLGDNLYSRSNNYRLYSNGFIIKNIDTTPNREYVEFNQGLFLKLGESAGGFEEDLMKAQVYETVEQHLKKELELNRFGIKVLSLFFIDRVANYRIYKENGSFSLGKLGKWFEAAYLEISKKPLYRELLKFKVEDVHNGYFSQDKLGKIRDTTGKLKDDESAYSLIMRDKEKLLDINQPLRFIFTHTALKEGWDNPNVFQICTLREVNSEIERRQQIGRGLRLCVDNTGRRVKNLNKYSSVNKLTIIAREDYESFAQGLQKEFEESSLIEFGRISPNAFYWLFEGEEKVIEKSNELHSELEKNGYIDENGKVLPSFDIENPNFDFKIGDEYKAFKPKIIDIIKKYLIQNYIKKAEDKKLVSLNKEVYLNPQFKELWGKISQKTKYNISFETEELINKASKAIANEIETTPILASKITMQRSNISINHSGVKENGILEHKEYEVNLTTLPNIIEHIKKETSLTQDTIIQILYKTRKLGEFLKNPQAFIQITLSKIKDTLNFLIIDGIEYHKIGRCYEQKRLEENQEMLAYLSKLYKVKNIDKSLFDYAICDSEVEKSFAKQLDDSESVKLFFKLPKWFVIDTPVGFYNPDWACVYRNGQNACFIYETKASIDPNNLRIKEKQKTDCAKKHFKSIDVNYEKKESLYNK